jgi:hypothetical protein
MISIRRLMLAPMLLVPLICARAEPLADPTGHWEGAVHAPTEDIVIAVDIAFDEKGDLVGTFSNPSQRLKGFPFLNVGVEGRIVTLSLKTSDPGTQTFAGHLSDDGSSMAGDLLVSVYSVPFSLERVGDPNIAPIPHSPRIDERLAGEWSASLAIGAQQLPMVLMMVNEADGTATGSWKAGDSVMTPVTIASDGGQVKLVSTVTPTEFSGSVSADGTQISGTIKQGVTEQPLTFLRTAHAK